MGTYAFVGDGSSGLLLALDISDPANPQLAGEYKTGGFVWSIFIAEPYVYVANGNGGMLILEIAIE